ERRVPGRLPAHHLEDHWPVERHLSGEKDCTHTAATQFFDHLVTGQRFRNYRVVARDGSILHANPRSSPFPRDDGGPTWGAGRGRIGVRHSIWLIGLDRGLVRRCAIA